MPPPRPALLVLNQYYAPGAGVDRAAADRALRGARRGVRRDRRHRHRLPRAETGADGPERRHDHPRRLDGIRPQPARAAGLQLPQLRRARSRGRPTASSAGARALPLGSTLRVRDRSRGRAGGTALRSLVVTQDVFPEIAVALGRLDNPVIVGVLGRLVRFGLSHATRVVAIGEQMRRRLVAKGVRDDAISVIPNWTDTENLVPRERANAWAQEHGLVDRFVVMHSGNLGYAQDLQTLLHAATYLRDLDDLEFVLIGSGAMGTELAALAKRLGLRNVRFLPYQPRERPRGVPFQRRRARGRARRRARRLRRPQPPLRDPRGGAARRRPCGRGERDGRDRADAPVRRRRPAGRSRAARAGDPRRARRSGRPRADGVRPHARTRRRRRAATSRSTAIAR